MGESKKLLRAGTESDAKRINNDTSDYRKLARVGSDGCANRCSGDRRNQIEGAKLADVSFHH